MLPTNVMSFMKKMVTNDPVPGADPADSGNTLSKLRQTLSSSLMNAQDKVTKLTPVRQTVQPEVTATVTPPEEKPEEPAPPPPKPQAKDPGRRAGTCRVCLKSFKPEEFFKMCSECNQKVCEDCASYSKLDENQDESTWSCSICRRKRQSRTQPIITQESTDSLLEVPILEALQRRHSDVKLGTGVSGNGGGGLGAGLAPPRSPELRRHSDVSPASLKEIEKVAGDRREELRWERELEWRKKGTSPGGSRVTSPSVERRPFPEDQRYAKSGLGETNGKEEEEDPLMQKGARNRRKSRIGRQHSYDDEIKNAVSGQSPSIEPGLGLPVSLPRRASAYDVYAVRQGEGLDPRAVAAAVAAVGGQSGAGAVPAVGGRRSSFRVAPKQEDPPSYEIPAPASPDGATLPGLAIDDDRRTRRRGSQLPDISNIRALQQTVPKAPPRVNPETLINSEPVRRQPSCDGEAIKIVIDDVDSDAAFVPRPGSKRRVVLRRDPADKAHRTRGFGMRVVGGKASIDGRLFAYIVWTVPGGPAEKAGLSQGDKVLEWCGISLIDRSFEEVCSVMDRTGDTAELLVEHANDLRMCDLLDDPGGIPIPSSRKSSNAEALGLALDSESDKAPSSPTRRKLPKTPEQIARERQVTGRVQIQVFYNDERKELSVAVLAADDLACRVEDTGFGSLPEAFAQLRLLPASPDQHSVKTDVAEPTPNPMWNATLEFSNVPGEDLMERTIEVTLWDYCPDKDPIFLGECTVDLQKAFLDDRPVWYRLEDPRQLRLGSKSPYVSPRGSLANEIAMRLMRRGDFASSRSFSDDRDSEGSQEFNLLHPDHAWATSGSRRGSSQSEGHLEPEAVYQLGQDFSRSLPGSRRSSFQSQQGDAKDQEGPPPQIYVNKGRRRSSVVRQDPEEILRSLKACKGDMLSRQMSLTGSEKRPSISHRRHSMESGYLTTVTKARNRIKQQEMNSTARFFWASCQPTSRKDSVVPLPEQTICGSSPDEDDDNWCSDGLQKLGPGQIRPKGHRGLISHGEVKLGLLMTKGQLEVEVVCARNIVGTSKDMLPDTYIKTYLRDNERWLQKRKTKVVSHSTEPTFRQTLRYSACDVFGRTLLVMLWERQKGFEHNQGLGGAELALDKLQLTQLTVGWYPLFPIHSLGSDSNDSP